MIHGLGRRLEEATKIHARLAENPIEAVAVGTGLAFERLDDLSDGFIRSVAYR